METTESHSIHTNERSFQLSDLWIAAGLLATIFFLAPLFPQLSNPRFSFFFRSIVFLLFALIGYRTGGIQLLSRLSRSPLILPGLAIILLTLAGLLYTPDLYRAKAKLSMLIAAFLLYAISYLLPLPNRHRRLLAWSLILGATAASLHALFIQWIGHDHLIESLANGQLYDPRTQKEMILSLKANRAIGRFGNPNHLAGYLVLSLWPLWLLWKESPSRTKRLVLAALAVLITAGVYRTFSRSGLLVLVATAVFIGGYECYLRGIRISMKKVLWILAGFIITIIVIILIVPPDAFGGRLLTLSTVVARIHFFRGALAIVQDHPWLGAGPEGFEAYYCEFIRPGDLESRYVHNCILEASTEGGILGLFCLLWLIGALSKFLRQQWRAASERRHRLFVAYGSSIVFLLLSFIDFHNNLMEMWIVPAFLIGIHSTGGVRQTKALQTARRTVPALALVLTAAWILLVLCRYYNETARQDAYYLVLDGQHSAARQESERAVFFDRSDAESWSRLGRIWSMAPTETARHRWLQTSRRAVELAPRRATFRADYADALYALGYPNQALDELKTAHRLFPARPRYLEKLAVLHRALGQPDQAEIHEKTARQLKKEIETKRQ